METLEQIKTRLEAAVPGANVRIVPNDSPSGQRSLLVDAEHGLPAARFLRDDPELLLNYCSNATGVDWPELLTPQQAIVPSASTPHTKLPPASISVKLPGRGDLDHVHRPHGKRHR